MSGEINFRYVDRTDQGYTGHHHKQEVKELKTYYKLLSSLENNQGELTNKQISVLIDKGYQKFEEKVTHPLFPIIFKVLSFISDRYKTNYNLASVQEKYTALKIKLISKALKEKDYKTCKLHIDNLVTSDFRILEWARGKADQVVDVEEKSEYLNIIKWVLEKQKGNFAGNASYIKYLAKWANDHKFNEILPLLSPIYPERFAYEAASILTSNSDPHVWLVSKNRYDESFLLSYKLSTGNVEHLVLTSQELYQAIKSKNLNLRASKEIKISN